MTGWWFGCHVLFSQKKNGLLIIIPTDFHSIIFQRGGVQTTNQMNSSEITWSLIPPEDRAEAAEALRSALLTAPASAAASAARRRMLGEARPEATLAWQGWEKIEVKGCKRWVCARVLVGLWLGQGWFMVGLWLVYGWFMDVSRML